MLIMFLGFCSVAMGYIANILEKLSVSIFRVKVVEN
jgi:hypothetical protein